MIKKVFLYQLGFILLPMMVFGQVNFRNMPMAVNHETYLLKLKDNNRSTKELQKILLKNDCRLSVQYGDILLASCPDSGGKHDFGHSFMEALTSEGQLAPNHPQFDLVKQLLHWEYEKKENIQAHIHPLRIYENKPDEGCITETPNDMDHAIALSERNERKQLLMCYKDPWVLCDTTAWPTVYEGIDILKIYIGDIAERVDQEQARCFIKALLDKRIKIAIELGGLLDWHADKQSQSAQYSFEQELAQISPLIQLIKELDPDRNIDILEFDGPIRRMLFPNNVRQNHHTLRTAMDELYKVIRYWKDEIPGVKINLISNFPNWAWDNTPAYFSIGGESNGYGQYRSVMNEIRQRNNHPVYKLDGLTIDNPYDYATGIAPTNQPEIIQGVDWMKRILELENNIKLLRLEANMIFNTNGARNDSMYFHQTLEFIEEYRQYGGRPEGYWIQSWYEQPQQWIPEDAPYTMTNLVKEVLPFFDIIDIDPNKTSDKLQGTSVAAVFFVNYTNAQNAGVPTWDSGKQNAAIANIIMNLVWWTNVAQAFGVQKTFVLEVYGFDHPVVQVDFDPTEGYIGTGSNNARFQTPIMSKLGYNAANSIMSMRAFAHDLRTEMGTDWAFCAFVLEGAHPVRANASLQGPATVLTRAAAASGFTFSHEVGHIYGAFDEYWESGASFRNQQSRYGVPNGNFHWRNYPVQPSMMASTFSGGISYYTAAHLGLTDKVRFTKVKVHPPNAIFDVAYGFNNGNFFPIGRYQGDVDFHWGEGVIIQLTALDNITYQSQLWEEPQWSGSGSNILTFTINSESPEIIELEYKQTDEHTLQSYEYLHVGNALGSPDVYAIADNGESLGFAGTRGVSVYDGEERILLDFFQGQQSIGIPYESRSAYVSSKGGFYFATTSGSIVVYENGLNYTLSSSTPTVFRHLAVTANGYVWAAVGSDDRAPGSMAQSGGLHLFINGEHQLWTTQNSGLPSNNVSGLAVNTNGNLLVSIFGPDDLINGLYEFNVVNGVWTNHSATLADKKISRLKQNENVVLLFYSDRIVLYKDGNFINNPIRVQAPVNLFDASVDLEGKIYLGTNQGLMVFDNSYQMIDQLRLHNSPIPSNIVYSVHAENSDKVIVGTANGVMIMSRDIDVNNTSDDFSVSHPNLRINPNPAQNYIFFHRVGELNVHSAESTIVCEIYDSFGRKALSQNIDTSSDHSYIDVSGLSAGHYFIRIGKDIQKLVILK